MKQVAPQTVVFISTCICCIVSTPQAQAQISPDGTLPTNVNKLGNVLEITGGAQAGSNLFHSFQEFSIPNGSSAFFNNSANLSNINNIINRVTGGSISNIDGLLRENYGANFILINPSGIIFGPNAQLSIGGSFLGSTANSLKFADGTEFNATNTQGTPRLTISVPTGLQFGQNPAPISVRGQGHNLSLTSPIFSPFTRGSTNGLKVQPGNTLALVGGDINLDGGTLTAEGGRIELGSAGEGVVNLDATGKIWTLGYGSTPAFRDIQMRQQALADTSGTGSGSIQLQGRNISLSDGSVVLIQTQGAESAGKININASESLNLIGTRGDGQLSTNIFTETIGGGKSGDINITTPSLTVSDGAAISAATYTAAPGGNINLNVSESVQVNGFSSVNPSRFSNITASAFGAGNAGNLAITTKRVTATGGGNIASVTAGTGSGGNVNVDAKESVELIGVTPFVLTPSQVTAGTGGQGKAGNVNINTLRLQVRNGARVDASTLASGSAGNVTINARDSVEVSGTVPGSVNPSLIISGGNIVDTTLQQLLRLPPVPSGNAGNVTIDTPKLQVTDGAQVTAGNSGSGMSGNIRINAGSIFLDTSGGISSNLGGGFINGNPVITSAFALGDVRGGDIRISTQQLIVRGGANVSTSTFNNATGGDVNIDAKDSVEVDGSAAFNPNNLSFITSGAFSSGNAGNINISTAKLNVLNGALIGAATFSTGSSGNVTVNATESVKVIGAEPIQGAGSKIGVSTLNAGRAGTVTIDTATLRVQDGGRIDSSTAASGSGGSITINASESVEVSGKGRIDPSLITAGANIESELARQLFRLPDVPSGSSGGLTINTPKLQIDNGALVTARNQGTGDGGDVRINARSIELNKGGITAATASGQGGNIHLLSDAVILRNDSWLSAATTGTGNGGNITISGFSPTDFVVLLSGSQITANAFQGRGGNISINSQGLFVCPDCQITASSQLGVNGIVEINSPDTEEKQETVNSRQEMLKPEEVVAQVCPSDRKAGQSQLITTGRGGLPPRPNEPLSSEALLSFEPESTANTNPSPTKTALTLPPPATGWYVNQKGALILTANSPNITPFASGLTSLFCHVK